jgi:allophanate hydrolase subunit 2
LKIEILENCMMAITGANLSPELDGAATQCWKSFAAQRHEILSFPKRRVGCRSYLSVGGGFQGNRVFGSRSTDLRNHWGGMDGRALVAGDILQIQHQPDTASLLTCRMVQPDIFRTYEDPSRLRVILGPQRECFSQAAVNQFLAGVYRVSLESDRMGYRLQGTVLPAKYAEIISDPIPVGALQVLPKEI